MLPISNAAWKLHEFPVTMKRRAFDHTGEEIMRHLMIGLVLAGGILAASAGGSQAQVSISIGTPYTYGPGVAIGNPGYAYGYNRGYSYFARPAYPGIYGGYTGVSTSAYVAGPGVLTYRSGYRGYAPPVVSYPVPVSPYGYVGNPYGYVNRPYYGAFGYGNYSNGSTDGFRPFRGAFSWLR
jgi:hypothetical protein